MAKKIPTPESMLADSGVTPPPNEAEATRKRLIKAGASLNLMPGPFNPNATPSPALPNPAEESATGAESAATPTGSVVLEIPLELIDPNPDQPRTSFDEEALNELAASLISQGQIQSIAVWQKPDGRYEIKAGERRYRASRIAGKTTIRAEIQEQPKGSTLLQALAENDAREGLTDFERFISYQRALDNGLVESQAELSRAVGKSKSTISRIMQFKNLPDKVLDYLKGGNEAAMSATYAGEFSTFGKSHPQLTFEAVTRIACRSQEDPHQADQAQLTALNWLKAEVKKAAERASEKKTVSLNLYGKPAGTARVEGNRILITCERGIDPQYVLKELARITEKP